MNLTSVICEYNPFHMGHAYQLSEMKKEKAVVAVMSGSFTQRGTPAVLSKYERASIAVLCGADLVLELPFPFSSARADIFGAAGVKILSSLGCVEEICFGSETGDIAPLLEAEARLSSPAFQNALAKTLSENRNISHRAAMTAVYRSLYGADSALTGSNDILALSYLAALREQKSPLKPTTVKRIGEAYNGEGKGFSSATSIREMLKRHDLEAVKRAVPQKCAEILIKSVKNGEICDEERLFSLFALLARTREDLLLEIPDIPSELAFRMIKSAKIAKNTEEFLSLAETKLYSRSRIRRGMLYAAVGVKKEDFDKVFYTTVLAANQTGREILSRIRKTAQIPIITKPADAVNFGEDVSRAFSLSARADSVWELLLPAPHSGERMMRERPRML
ncbi:MAG: nucleotidyltransferase family protein [Clostridia bacterium]|nr:nucleotidyltransferase family protein [Clostridia bacterium]